MVPAVAVKVAVVAAAATVTEAGTVRAALLLDKVTAVAADAVLLRVTVQVLEAPEPRLVGLQATEESTVGATRLRVAVWETPLKVAVTMAV